MIKRIPILMILAIALALVMIWVFPDAQAVTYYGAYYTYEVVGGEATITGCNTSISGNITIPATLSGYPVTTIGNSAFSDCDSLTGIWVNEANPNYLSSFASANKNYA